MELPGLPTVSGLLGENVEFDYIAPDFEPNIDVNASVMTRSRSNDYIGFDELLETLKNTDGEFTPMLKELEHDLINCRATAANGIEIRSLFDEETFVYELTVQLHCTNIYTGEPTTTKKDYTFYNYRDFVIAKILLKKYYPNITITGSHKDYDYIDVDKLIEEIFS